MFEVGDEVYFESRNETGEKVYSQGIGVVSAVDNIRHLYSINIDGILQQVATEDSDNYKHDVIRKLTKLDLALK